jgi:hypothetical protein
MLLWGLPNPLTILTPSDRLVSPPIPVSCGPIFFFACPPLHLRSRDLGGVQGKGLLHHSPRWRHPRRHHPQSSSSPSSSSSSISCTPDPWCPTYACPMRLPRPTSSPMPASALGLGVQRIHKAGGLNHSGPTNPPKSGRYSLGAAEKLSPEGFIGLIEEHSCRQKERTPSLRHTLELRRDPHTRPGWGLRLRGRIPPRGSESSGLTPPRCSRLQSRRRRCRTRPRARSFP